MVLSAFYLVVLLVSNTQAISQEAEVKLAGHEGTVVLVDFWASWCAPCRESFPWLNKLTDQYDKSSFKVIAVNVDENRDAAEAFLKEFPAKFDIMYDSESQLLNHFGVFAMPTSFLFDADGKLIAQHLGFQSATLPEYEDKIAKAIEQAQKTRVGLAD